jgi:superkiller protein 3
MIAAYTALGNLYLDAKKYDEAIAAYQQGIREGYYDMDWGTNFYLSIGNVYQEMGDTERALAYYHMLERYDPATSGPYLSAGQIYKDQGNLPAAIEQFQKATYAEPFDVMPYLQIAAIYQQVGMDEQMDAMYQTALGIDPYSDKVWLLYANRLLGTDVEKARQAYQKAMELNASNSAVYVGIGNIASTEQRWDDALANFYLAILRSPSSSQGFVALGDALGEVANLNEAANAYTQAIKADPENPGAYAKLSNTYRLMGEMSKAVEVDQEALQAVPDSVEALLSLANTYQEQKQYDQSAELYRRVLELDPTQVRPYLSLAEIALAQDNDQKTALEMYQAAVSANPSYGLAITALGDFYFKQGQLDLAEQAYRLVLDQPEVSASDYLAVSNIQKMRGKWDQALLTLQTAVDKVSDPSAAYCNLAVFYIGRASLDDAKAAYQQAIQIEPENAQGYAGLAGLAIRLGEFDLAAQTLEQGAQNASDKSAIHTAQAIYLEATGDLKQAENELLATILPPVNSTEPYQNLAQFYRDAGRFTDAISIYQQALLEFPYNMQLLIGMGQTYASLNRIDDAINWFQVAASADKSDPSPYLALSSLYSSQGKLPEAEQAAKQAVTIRPTSVDAYLTLAQVYDSMQRPDLARWEYQEACKLDQSQADCLVGLSQLDWQSRDYAQSIANLQAAIAIQPSMAELYQSLAQNYQSQGNVVLAEQTLSEGIDKAQDREAAWLARAEYYASLGKWEQAEGDYRTAAQAYPYSQNAPAMHRFLCRSRRCNPGDGRAS